MSEGAEVAEGAEGAEGAGSDGTAVGGSVVTASGSGSDSVRVSCVFSDREETSVAEQGRRREELKKRW